MEKLIKNVDEHSWRDLKVEAAKQGKPIGRFLTQLVTEHKKMETEKNNWDIILKRGKMLTKAEAKVAKNAILVFEKEYDFE